MSNRCLFISLLLVGAAVGRVFALEQETGDQGQRLHALFDAEWDWTMKENPTWASQLGDPRHDDRWPDVSLDVWRQRKKHRQKILERLDTFDVEKLSKSDRVNLALFRREYASKIEGHQYRWFLLPLTMRGGIQSAATLATSLRFKTVKDYENWLARIESFPEYMDDTISLMRAGLREGRMHPKIVMQRVPNQIRQQIVDDPALSRFYTPFRKFSDDVPEKDRERLRTAAKKAIQTKVVPAYKKMLVFFERDYLPGSFDKVGAWQLPDGQNLYAFRARSFTTTKLTPKEIHEIGLTEVSRIRREMKRVIAQVKFKGTFREFLDDLRTNPRFFYKNPNDLLQAYKDVGPKVDSQLNKLFNRLPRVPYDVQAIPPHIAPDTTTGYYRPPSADGRRPGTYFVNLYRPEVRPKYEIEALSLHEAVPGHHLQIALAMELENLPSFRRFGGYTAFVEGWGLYSESLGKELGLYRDPYSEFGRLTYEMWRAVRLVVDTGMHSFQWTRQQSIEYFKENTAKTEVDIVNEVDRYIAWPGQALAYKIGELKIKELRARAEKSLGKRFDIRDFHDVVLGSGAVTLDVLETKIDEWITNRKR